MVVGVVPEIAAPKLESAFGVRHVIILLLFLATTVSYATRVSMSIAIVAMTQTESNSTNAETYDWDKSIQDTILSSFFWGYIVLQIPAGMLAGRFGGKQLIFFSMVLTGITNLFTPFAASHGGWMAVCACRIIMGLFSGLLYPSVHGLLGQWAPISERSRMGTIVYAGAQLGTIIEMLIAGVLSATSWGWPSIFYVASVTCFAWSILWIIFGASAPSDSWLISKEERKFIETNVGSSDIADKKNMKTPWKAIWTSLPFWAILLVHSAQSLGFWTLLTEMPSYLNKVLDVKIDSKGGFLSALPYVAMYLLSFFFSWIADWLVNNKIVTLGTSRKIFNTISFWGPAAALLVLSYLPPGNLNLSVAILTITTGLNAAHYVGFLISHIDLAPNFASTLMGITNGIGNSFSILAPLSVSFVVKDETSATEWRKVFFISIAFYFLSNLFYLLFMSGEIQPWNEPKPKETVEDGVKKKESESRKAANIAEERF